MTARRRGRDTETLTPEQFAEAIAKRLESANREPAPERVVYSWPDEPVDADEITQI